MKKLCYLLVFGLAGCVPHYADYQPKLAAAPKNAEKYESDRKFCLDEGLRRKKESRMLFDADSNKTPRQMVDECMAAKGYAVIKVDHCC